MIPPVETRLPAAAGLTLLLAAAALPSAARAEEAREGGAQLFEEARFEEAAAAFEAVLADAGAAAEAVARAHLYLGALRLIDGEAEAARGHAAAAAAVDPGLQPPPGAPVQLGEMLAAAAAALPPGGMGLELDAPECPPADAPFRVRAALAGAPTGLVESVALHCDWDGGEAHAAGDDRGADLVVAAEDLAAGGEVRCRATARTASDALLRSSGRTLRLCPGREPEVVAPLPDAGAGEGGGPEVEPGAGGAGPPSVVRSPWLWTGVGLGAAAVVASVVLAVFLTSQPAEASLGPIRLDGP